MHAGREKRGKKGKEKKKKRQTGKKIRKKTQPHPTKKTKGKDCTISSSKDARAAGLEGPALLPLGTPCDRASVLETHLLAARPPPLDLTPPRDQLSLDRWMGRGDIDGPHGRHLPKREAGAGWQGPRDSEDPGLGHRDFRVGQDRQEKVCGDIAGTQHPSSTTEEPATQVLRDTGVRGSCSHPAPAEGLTLALSGWGPRLQEPCAAHPLWEEMSMQFDPQPHPGIEATLPPPPPTPSAPPPPEAPGRTLSAMHFPRRGVLSGRWGTVWTGR